MSSDGSSVPLEVQNIVVAWAGAPDYEAALQVLAGHSAQLSAEHRAILTEEVLQVSVEVLGRLITKSEGLDERPTESIGPLDLHPVQVERFLAWLADQSDTAKALGLDPERWMRRLERGARASPDVERLAGMMDREHASRAADAVGGDNPKSASDVQADRSEQAGLTGLLAARRFKKKP